MKVKRLFTKTIPALTLAASCLVLSACGAGTFPEITEHTSPTGITELTQPAETEATVAAEFTVTPAVKEKLDQALKQSRFEGVVQLSYQGEVIYQSATGDDDLGNSHTIESPMFIGSISKQFCAASILMLRDQGKLSLEDTLGKYFPEYTIGKDITIQKLLSMRSGIVRDCEPMGKDPQFYLNQTKDENIASFKEWVFDQPLHFEPGNRFSYSNVNYTLLGLIVEQVSGEEYGDFLRKNILEPVGMVHTGFAWELKDNPEWAKGVTYEGLNVPDQTDIQYCGQIHGMLLGCGEIISTAGDMDLWMTALRSGKVISDESYREMTANYGSGGYSDSYGYGVMPGIRGGVEHGGNIGSYASMMYFNEEYGLNLYMNSSSVTFYTIDSTQKSCANFLRTVFQEIDAARK